MLLNAIRIETGLEVKKSKKKAFIPLNGKRNTTGVAAPSLEQKLIRVLTLFDLVLTLISDTLKRDLNVFAYFPEIILKN